MVYRGSELWVDNVSGLGFVNVSGLSFVHALAKGIARQLHGGSMTRAAREWALPVSQFSDSPEPTTGNGEDISASPTTGQVEQ